MYWKVMQYFPGRHNYLYNLIEDLKDFIASRVKINEASFDPSNPRDFIDCFLIKMHQVPLPLTLVFLSSETFILAMTKPIYNYGGGGDKGKYCFM
jgi:hypothetical protein